MQDDSRLWRAVRQYLGGLEDRNLASGYIRLARYNLRRFTAYCMDRNIKCPRTISSQILSEYLKQFDGGSAAYQRLIWTHLRGLLISTGHPLSMKYKPQIRGRGREVSWLTPAQVEQVLTRPMAPQLAYMICGGLLAGLRQCELRAMRISDLRLSLRTGKLFARAKGYKVRQVPLHPEYRLVIERFLATLDLPGHARVLPFSANSYCKVIRAFSRSIGIPFKSHTLRRTFATILRRKGKRLEVIRDLLGHSHIATTELYLDTGMEELQDAIDSLEVPQIVQRSEMPAR